MIPTMTTPWLVYNQMNSSNVSTLMSESTYGHIENIFAPTKLFDLKAREKAFMERNEKGYYFCEMKYPKLYNDMTLAYNIYNIVEILR